MRSETCGAPDVSVPVFRQRYRPLLEPEPGLLEVLCTRHPDKVRQLCRGTDCWERP